MSGMKVRTIQRAATAMVGIATMLVALFTAPLFHSHEEVEHGRHVSTVHAHFVEDHEADTGSTKDVTEQEACGTGSDDGDLRSHGSRLSRR